MAGQVLERLQVDLQILNELPGRALAVLRKDLHKLEARVQRADTGRGVVQARLLSSQGPGHGLELLLSSLVLLLALVHVDCGEGGAWRAGDVGVSSATNLTVNDKL